MSKIIELNSQGVTHSELLNKMIERQSSQMVTFDGPFAQEKMQDSLTVKASLMAGDDTNTFLPKRSTTFPSEFLRHPPIVTTFESLIKEPSHHKVQTWEAL